jgi:hypothetical protein
MPQVISALGVISAILFSIAPQFNTLNPKTAAWLALIGTTVSALSGALVKFRWSENRVVTVIGAVLAVVSVLAGANDLLHANIVFILTVLGTALAAVGRSLFGWTDGDLTGSGNGGSIRLALPWVLAVGLLSLTTQVGCARRQTGESADDFRSRKTAIYSAQTVAALAGLQDVVFKLNDSGVVTDVQTFAATHDRISTGLENILLRLQAGGYDRTVTLTAINQIVDDFEKLNSDLKLTSPVAQTRLDQVVFTVRFSLNSIRAVIAATQEPNPAEMKPAIERIRSSTELGAGGQPAWYTDVILIVQNTLIRTLQQSRFSTLDAWQDVARLIAQIHASNAGKLR